MTGPSNQHPGRLVDVIARLAGANSAGWHPAVTGLVVDFDGEERFAHAHQLVSLSYEVRSAQRGARATSGPSSGVPARCSSNGTCGPAT